MATSSLTTEHRNPNTTHISTLPTLQLCQTIHTEDSTIPSAITPCLPTIASAIDALTSTVRNGGRIIYIGAGTSGRLGVLDASEIPPTFSAPPGQFIGLIAGGDVSLRSAQEGAEDEFGGGEEDLKGVRVSGRDAVVGIASSGRTPYVLGALRYARELGCGTAGIACVGGSEMGRSGDVGFMIEVVTGAEVVTGSTRMKAGTATKMVLNMLSTGTMIKLGKTYGNIMIDVKPTNVKLQQRARRIVRDVCGGRRDLTDEQIDHTIAASNRSVKVAAVALALDVTADEAQSLLMKSNGNVGLVLHGQKSHSSESEYVLCIDAGGTKCKAVLSDPHGNEFVGAGGPCNVASIGVDGTVNEMQSAIRQALQQPAVDVSSLHISKVHCGVAGSEVPALRRALRERLLSSFPYCQDGDLRLVNDIELLAVVAFEENPDTNEVIALLSGTGSIAMRYTRTPSGPMLTGRTGGWGAFLGDDGSGYDIGREAIRLVLCAIQNQALGSEVMQNDPLVPEILKFYNVQETSPALYDLLGHIVSLGDGHAKQKISGCAETVVDLNETSPAGQQIIRRAIQSLVELVQPLIAPQKTKDGMIVLSGGLMRSPHFRADLAHAIGASETRHIDDPAVKVARILAKKTYLE